MSDDRLAAPQRDLTDVSNGECPSRRILRDGGGGDADVRDGPALDALFRVLASQRRRHVLYEFRAKEAIQVEALATAVAAAERGLDRDAVGDDAIDRARARLLHADIPMLEEVGLVEHDPRSGVVRFSDPPPVLDPLLQLCADIDEPS